MVGDDGVMLIPSIKKYKELKADLKGEKFKILPVSDGIEDVVDKGIPKKVDSVIKPQDKATIEYLSNVEDEDGNISGPFNVSGKNYQIIRGITPSKEVVLAVYCHDDVDDEGNNQIHDMDYFEENFVNPAMIQQENDRMSEEAILDEKKSFSEEEVNTELPLTPDNIKDYEDFYVNLKNNKITKRWKAGEWMKSNDNLDEDCDFMDKAEVIEHMKSLRPKVNEEPVSGKLPDEPVLAKSLDGDKAIGLGDYKFFLVDNTTGKFRKFKTLEELAKANMSETEKLMGLKEMKKFFESKVFGERKKKQDIFEEEEEDAVALKAKAQKLVKVIDSNVIVKNSLDSLAELKGIEGKSQVLSAILQRLKIPIEDIQKYVSQIKKMVTKGVGAPVPEPVDGEQSIGESKKYTKNQLMESMTPKTKTTIIKVKDIK
jgi:DNA-binding protein